MRGPYGVVEFHSKDLSIDFNSDLNIATHVFVSLGFSGIRHCPFCHLAVNGNFWSAPSVHFSQTDSFFSTELCVDSMAIEKSLECFLQNCCAWNHCQMSYSFYVKYLIVACDFLSSCSWGVTGMSTIKSPLWASVVLWIDALNETAYDHHRFS